MKKALNTHIEWEFLFIGNVGSFIYNNETIIWSQNISSNQYVEYQSNPVKGSSFTARLVGFWNETLAKSNGYNTSDRTDEYF
mgnify:CR=1 FL=1